MSKARRATERLTGRELDQLVEKATVDAHGEEEQAVGLFTKIEEELALPFKTRILGVEASVIAVELDDGTGISAICRRGSQRQAVSLADLPLPSPPPPGAKWIAAYRHWARGRAGFQEADESE